MNEDINIRFAQVLEVEGGGVDTDYSDGQRIRVRLEPEDKEILKDVDLPWVFPLIPKMVHVIPKVGETVMIMLAVKNGANNNRFYIGPVISQPMFMYKESNISPLSLLESHTELTIPERNPRTAVESRGTSPDLEDVAIEGRLNADLVLKDNEVRLRAGYKKHPMSEDPMKRMEFNDVDMAYIQMVYDDYGVLSHKIENGKVVEYVKNDFHSVINVVADRINLLSYDSSDYFTMNDRKDLISKKEVAKIIQNAHPVIYGDDFMLFMRKFINIFLNHKHNLLQAPALAKTDSDILKEDLNVYLSKSIRVN